MNAEKLCAEALKAIGSTKTDYVCVIHHHKLNLQICLYDMIYLLTVIGLTSSGSSTVDIYTQTIQITTQLRTEQHN
jgi:hypothetical protein